MLRWLLRLGFVGIVVAAAVWIWSQMNQDLDEDELDEEIPIEFEVPLDPDATVSLNSATVGDTGVGPGADFAAEQNANSGVVAENIAEFAPSQQDVLAADEVADDASSDNTSADQLFDIDESEASEATDSSTSEKGSDLIDINGIGPVFAGRLTNAGISSIAELAESSPENLHDLGFNETYAADWIKQAQDIINADK